MKKILSIFLIVIFIISLIGIYYLISHSSKNESFQLGNINSNNLFKIIPIENVDESKIAFKYSSEGMFDIDMSNNETIANKAEYIIIGKVESIDGVVNYNPSSNHYVMARTIGNINVLQVLKGNIEETEIPFIRLGGTLPISEFEKSLYDEQITKMNLDQMTQEYKENTYVSEETSGDIKIETDKTYLMYLNYSQDYERYNIKFMEYGLREISDENILNSVNTFDTNQYTTIKVKNNKTGEYETLDSILPSSITNNNISK